MRQNDSLRLAQEFLGRMRSAAWRSAWLHHRENLWSRTWHWIIRKIGAPGHS